jgi:heat shock protein HslJ
MRAGRFIAMLVVLAVALTVVGCGSSGGSGGKIEGINWELRSNSSSGTARAIPSTVAVTALFKTGRISGNSGVNTYSGTYKLSGGSLTISKVATTLMAGPPEAMAVEQAYVAALEKVRSYTSNASGLSLFDSAGKQLLFFVQGKAVTLKGPWNVVSFFDGGSAVVGVMSGTSLTAEFGSSGVLKGSTGVNEYQGNYKVNGSSIAITGVKTTTGNQNPNPGVMEQEAQFLAALPLATTYTIKGDRLDLLRQGGTIAVVFQIK